MGTTLILSQALYSNITYLSLAILLFSCIYTTSYNKRDKELWLFFTAILLDFFSIYISQYSNKLFAQGEAVDWWVFVELLMRLGAMLFLCAYVSKLMKADSQDKIIIYGLGALGIIGIIFFLFIYPNNKMITQMHNIFPLVGFIYLTFGCLIQCNKKRNSGFVMMSMSGIFASLIMFFKFIGINYFIEVSWYLPACVYAMFSLAILMMKTDFYAKKYDDSNAEVEKSYNRIDEIIKYSPFPIIISRLSDDRLLVANTNAVKLFDIMSDELERYHLKDFFADSENRKILNERLEKERVVQDFEILVKTPMGNTPFWLLASANIIDYNYDVALYMAFQDITSRKSREALLKNQATRDPLTAIFNRRYFEEEVFKRIVDAKVNNQPFSVLMIDADHFKNVNDTYGHKTGDKVLIELAATCEKALRNDDIVARYGGEEFVVFLSGVDAQKGKIVADRLREQISEIVVYSDEGQEVRFTVSIGVSSSEVSDNIDTLIKTADEALYKAKEGGRNRVEIFSKEDLAAFDNKEAQERINNELNSRHPIFDKEENEEISLLDGIESNHIQSNNPQIETKENSYPLLGVDEEDMK